MIVVNLLDPDVAARANAGCDAVLSCLGFRRHLLGPATTTLYSDSARTFVGARDHVGRRRLIFIPSVRPTCGRTSTSGSRCGSTAAEAIIGESGLAWVLVRPGRLTGGPASGRYEVSPRHRPEHANSVSRADLAAFMLAQVTGDAWVHGTPTPGPPQPEYTPTVMYMHCGVHHRGRTFIP